MQLGQVFEDKKKNQFWTKVLTEEKLNVLEVRFWQGFMFMLGRTEEIFEEGLTCIFIVPI